MFSKKARSEVKRYSAVYR